MSNNIKWNSVEKYGHINLGNIKTKHLQEKVSKIINTILFVYYIKCNTWETSLICIYNLQH